VPLHAASASNTHATAPRMAECGLEQGGFIDASTLWIRVLFSEFRCK